MTKTSCQEASDDTLHRCSPRNLYLNSTRIMHFNTHGLEYCHITKIIMKCNMRTVFFSNLCVNSIYVYLILTLNILTTLYPTS
jgi:hypothetical protein